MSQNKGAISRTAGDKGIRETWARCDEMSRGRDDGAFYAPWEAIVVQEKLLPRHIDGDVVQRYAGVAAELPPIVVQRDTYVLIDGLHRLRAAPKADRDMILVREVDIEDDGLALAAFEANLSNGLPYTLTERVNGAKLMLQAHPEWSNTVIGQKCGIDPDTVSKHRHRLEAFAERTVGADGRETKPRRYDDTDVSHRNSVRDTGVTTRKPVSQHAPERVTRGAPVSTFEPDPEPEPPDEPSRQVEEDGDESGDEWELTPEARKQLSAPAREQTPAEMARAKFDDLERRQAAVAANPDDFITSMQVVHVIKLLSDLAEFGDEHTAQAFAANLIGGQRGYVAKLLLPVTDWLGHVWAEVR